MRIHLVPNSHIDPVWLWDKYEGIDEVINTFRAACDRLDEYPDLTFAASSMQFYEWVLQYDPKLFERIQEKVAEARWEVVGGWWVEADTNLLTEASFLKHAELSRSFAREHFRKDIEIAYLPDTFGHPATLPRILAQTGFRYFIFCRPNQVDKPDLPANLFHWEYAGHRVLAYRLKHHYAQSFSHGSGQVDAEHLLSLLNDKEYRINPVNCFFFGVGDHGGGPSIKEIEFYNRYIQEQPNGDIGYSTSLRFFEEAARNPSIPCYSGDLHLYAVGCYSVMRNVKEAVRSCEHGLQVTTRALEISGKCNKSLVPLWKKTIFNQFHDILPGSCSREAADQALAELGGVVSACHDTTYAALKSLSGARPVETREGEFRIFNTLPFEVTVPLSIESFMYFREDAAFLDGNDREIPIQEVLPSVRCMNRRWDFVDSLPARSFKSYHFDNQTIVKRHGGACFQPGDRIAMGGTEITADGTISVQTNAGVRALLLEQPVRFLMLADQSDTWGHDVRVYDDVIDAFTLGSWAVQTGGVTSKLYQRWTCHRSTIDVIYSLYDGLPQIHVDLGVNWAENRRILKMQIHPAGVCAPLVTMQGAGGAIERRADGMELPLHHWVWLPGSTTGMAVVQDGAFACDCVDGRLRLTLVRSSLYGFHSPTVLGPNDPQQDTDQGAHRFRMRFLPCQPLDTEQLYRFTAAFLEPFHVFYEGCRAETKML